MRRHRPQETVSDTGPGRLKEEDLVLTVRRLRGSFQIILGEFHEFHEKEFVIMSEK